VLVEGVCRAVSDVCAPDFFRSRHRLFPYLFTPTKIQNISHICNYLRNYFKSITLIIVGILKTKKSDGSDESDD